jgi:Ca2+-binding RTX toxin-like protein
VGYLRLVKVVQPAGDSGKFNLKIGADTIATNVGNHTTTDQQRLTGQYTVSETAGTSTALGNYFTTVSCRSNNGNGPVVASATNAGSVVVTVVSNQTIVCTLTNTRIPDECLGMTFDRATAGASNVLGTPERDLLIGSDGSDIVAGGAGDDCIDGRGGNDTLNGDAGFDTVLGGLGNDTLTGGAGNDRLLGGNGNDVLSGNDGNDSIAGNAGVDTANGAAGFDTCTNNVPGGAGTEVRLSCEIGAAP